MLGPTVLVYVSFSEGAPVRGGPRSMFVTATNLKRYRPFFVLTQPNSFFSDLQRAGIGVALEKIGRPLDGFRSSSVREKFRRAASIVRHDLELVRIARLQNATIFHCQDTSEAIVGGLAMRLSGRAVVMHIRGQGEGRVFSFLLAALISSRVVFVSAPLREDYVNLVPSYLRGWLRSRSTSVPNGIRMNSANPPDADAAREAIGLPRDAFVATIIGPFTDNKNQLELLRWADPLLALSEKLHVVFVGSMQQDSEYASRVASAATTTISPERIHFLGERPHESMPDVYAATDVVLIPSKKEGLPRVALEAYSFGRPVIAVRHAGTEAAVQHSKTGLLVNCVAEFSDAVSTLLNANTWARVSDGARQFLRDSFDADRVTSIIEEIYDECSRASLSGN